MFKRAKASY